MKLSQIPFPIRKNLKAAVDKGARRLDHRYPNWFLTIDPKMLDLSSPCLCVIGQLYGDYDANFLKRVLNNLRITDPFKFYGAADRYGFTLTDEATVWIHDVSFTGDEIDRADACWRALDTYWKQEILARRKARTEANNRSRDAALMA